MAWLRDVAAALERAPPGAIPASTAVLSMVAYLFGSFTVNEITAISNSLWGLGALAASFLAHIAIRRRLHELTPVAQELCYGIRLAGAAVFLHRLWWNFGIWLGENGQYWEITKDHRWFTVLLIAAIARGSQRAAAPYVRAMFKKRGAWAVEAAISVLAVFSAIPA